MSRLPRNLGPMTWTIGGVGALCLWSWLLLASAQQAAPAPPPPTTGIPPPTCQGELMTAKQYNTILLNNTTQYETSARELWQQNQDLRKERDEALAKLKAQEPAKDPAANATN